MTDKISAEKQCFSWMLAMGSLSAACSLLNRTLPHVPWTGSNPSVGQSALFGALWGAMIHFQNYLAPNLPGIRRIEVLYASAIFPALVLYDSNEPIHQILLPYTPIAIACVAYRIIWAKAHGQNIL